MTDLHHAMERFWITTNAGFLLRYWHTATEALQSVKEAPEKFAEFNANSHEAPYVVEVLSNHLHNNNYGALLLTYALLDEFLVVLAEKLGRALGLSIFPSDLKDRGVRRYKTYVERVCQVTPSELAIEWGELIDLASLRNFIIHANGNLSHAANRREIEKLIDQDSRLRTKHGVKLVVLDQYVVDSIGLTKRSALRLNDYIMSRVAEQELAGDRRPIVGAISEAPRPPAPEA